MANLRSQEKRQEREGRERAAITAGRSGAGPGGGAGALGGTGSSYLRRCPRNKTAVVAGGAGTQRPPDRGAARGGGSRLAASRDPARHRPALQAMLWLSLCVPGALFAQFGRQTDPPALCQLLNLADTWAEAARSPRASPPRPRPPSRHSQPAAGSRAPFTSF